MVLAEAQPVRTWQRRVLWAAVVIVCVVLGAMKLYDFLAINRPFSEGVLVVEAWIPPTALSEAVQRFDQGSYDYLVVVGGPMAQDGKNPEHFASYADLAEALISREGLDPAKIVKVKVAKSDTRTLSMAKAVDQWLAQSGRNGRTVDVFTVGVHARKSWISFQHVSGGRYRVGIISGAERAYDPEKWLLSRRGLWIVSRNLAGYLYTRVVLI